VKRRTQADLVAELRSVDDTEARRDAALDLLAATRRRERIELALGTLADPAVSDLLDTGHRAPLRAFAASCFERPADDHGGSLRERLVGLLGRIGHHDDADLLLLGCRSYGGAAGVDLLQGLRAASLAALARTDLDLARTVAVRLLGEPDTSPMTGQPSLAAIEVLAHADDVRPVYGFLLARGDAFLRPPTLGGEVVGKAFSVLGPVLPPELLEELVDLVPGWAGDPAAGAGVVEGVVARRDAGRHALLAEVLRGTRHREVVRYAAVLLATTRLDEDRAFLYEMARGAPPARAEDLVEGIELTVHPERDALLEELRSRARSGG
jgi:hypothetical protein